MGICATGWSTLIQTSPLVKAQAVLISWGICATWWSPLIQTSPLITAQAVLIE